MLPITGKTRRGRPPKFQQYWLALAKQKAEEKLQLSRAGNQENKDKDDLKYGVKFTHKDCSSAELDETRHNQENATAGKLTKTLSNTANVPLPLSHHRGDWITSKGDEIQLRECSFNRRFSAGDLEERLSAAAKRSRQDLQNSYDDHAPRALCSTWPDGTMVEVIGYDMPLMLTIPSQQPFAHAIQKSVEENPTAGDGGLDCQNVDLMQSCQGISKPIINTDERTGFNGESNTLKNWLIDVERCECAIDLSKSKANRQTAETLELPDTGISIPAERISENRTPLDTPHSWNLGAMLSMTHPWNDQNGLVRTGCLASPSQLRPPFPQFSMKRLTRLSEVSMWSADQVARFVSSVPGCQEYAECFRQQDIDGVCLLQLSENHLLNVIRMKLGPSLHLKKAISDLTGVAKNDILI